VSARAGRGPGGEESMNRALGKIDFHLHSYASNVTDYYAANALAIPESYSDPFELHRLLGERGMSLMTLTDHNSIDGAKALLDAGKANVFISSEMTTTFPEDGCNIHVTVANMTERQFSEVNRLRGNIYEMIAYVDREIAANAPLAYFMTHPLMSTQNRTYGREGSLSITHIEKALLLMNAFEVQNGSRTRALNDVTLTMVRRLDQESIERLANRHDIAPKGERPWQKTILAGSDDHAGINPGRTWTEFPYDGAAPTVVDLIRAMRNGETRPAGAHGGPITLAHSILKLLYDGNNPRVLQRAAGAPSRRVTPSAVNVSGPIQSMLELIFEPDSQTQLEKILLEVRLFTHRVASWFQAKKPGLGEPFERVFESEIVGLLADPAFRRKLDADGTHTDERIFLVVGTLLNRIFARYVKNLRGAGGRNLVCVIKEVVAMVTSNLFVSLPYLMSFLAQSTDSRIAHDVRRALHIDEPPKVALLTDTFFEVNGVAATIKRMIREAVRRGHDFTVVTCLGEHEYSKYTQDPEVAGWIASGRLVLFTCVAQLDLPKYDRLQIRFPPLLELLRFLQERGFTKMQLSTPGIMGLAGLFAAKTLQLETSATYHTSIPEYVEDYTKDISLEELAWKYMLAFYHAVDEVLVPSKSIARLLHKRGLRNRKLLVLDRWVDVNRFHPRHRTEGFWERWGIRTDCVFIYVGRLGAEKNLDLAIEAFRRLDRGHLVLVGDGPYRAHLEEVAKGLPVTFTGFLGGDDLCRAIASADVKVFPSVTDTWGNAPLEAQASGIPVIVSTMGGPAELMLDGKTGLRVSGRDFDELRDAMATLLDPAIRTPLGEAARAFAEANRVDEPFRAVFDADELRRQLRAQKALREAHPNLSELASVYFADDDRTERQVA
jgi:glycosyltransferase involved in cell wall biosynthesis/predicted metal-dependent phosphoesterase TrpH